VSACSGRALRALAVLGFLPYFASMLRQGSSRKNSFLYPCLALTLGQALSSIHTIVNSVLNITSDDFLIGAVSESGQLAIVIPFCAALILATLKNRKENPRLPILLSMALGIMLIALLVNLKRGPWLGAAVGINLLFVFYRPKLIIPFLAATAILILGVEPIQTRLAASLNHFFIGGGRSNIWNVGLDLVAQYPLGVGYDNSRVMQTYDALIPHNLKHMHNNFLNLTVETGWIGAALFANWLLHISRHLLSVRSLPTETVLARGLLCSIVSWQVAGFVEYNIGDTEVLLIVLFLVAVVLTFCGNANQSEHPPLSDFPAITYEK
jgi:O-antigen ligase